jgi:glycosyltransferase involved in cell wall biosynthesis
VPDLRLALDAEPVGRDGSGNERYLRGLIQGLHSELGENDRLLLCSPRTAQLHEYLDDNTALVRTPPGLVGDLLWGRKASRAGSNVVVANYVAPIAFSGTVATIVHDVAWRRFPQTFPAWLRARLEATTRWSIKRSDILVTSSSFSRDELVDTYRSLEPDRVLVVPGAPTPSLTLAATCEQPLSGLDHLDLPDCFVLAVGNLQPRKNLRTAAAACHAAKVPLVVAGRPVWGNETPAPRALGAVWLGRVSDEELAILYHRCSAFVYPSLYEGFGLPVIEAMAAGAPVICSTGGSLPEVAGDAAFLFDPYDERRLAQLVDRVVHDPELHRKLSLQSRARSREYSWQGSARILIDALRSVLPRG